MLVFTTIAFVMLIAPPLAERFRIPDIVLLLLSGAVLGPKGLGILEHGPAVKMFGAVGLIYIMFSAGLEIDPHRFSRTRGRSVAFGLLTFAAPQALGTLAGRYLLGLGWMQSVLLASMFASHTLLTYPLAQRLGISRLEPVAITVGATIVCNTLSLMVLAVVANLSHGAALWGTLARIAAGGAALAFATLAGVPRVTRWFMGRVTEAGGTQFLFVFVTLCACAALSRAAGLEPIIGAFLAGVAFNRLMPPQGVLMNRVEFAGNTLFIPFFLISTGMEVDFRALVSSWRGVWVAAVMVLATIGTKFAAAWLAGKAFRLGRAQTRVMFGLSVVQAAATLAAVAIGRELGIFDDAVFNGAIAMIIFTCPLGSWATDKYGRRMAAGAGAAAPPEEDADAGRILVPVVKDSSALRTMELAILLRGPRARAAAIHPITIAPDDENADASLARAERLVARCHAMATAAETPVRPSVRIDINASDGIARAAKELRCALTLVAWDDSPRYGGVMRNLVHSCASRLFFCRLPEPLGSAKRLLLLLPPLAHQRADAAALARDAKRLSAQAGAPLHVRFSSASNAGLRRLFEKISPETPAVFSESAALTQALRELDVETREGDLVLIASERRGSAHWAPAMERHPEAFAARHPANGVIVAYPPLRGVDDSFPAPAADGDAPPRAVCLDFPRGAEPLALEAALPRMCAAAFPDEPGVRLALRRQLLASAAAYPAQITPEAVLLHAHSDAVPRPALMIACGDFLLPKSAMRCGVLLCLVSPKMRGAERHLRNLSHIASAFSGFDACAAVEARAPASAIAAIIGWE